MKIFFRSVQVPTHLVAGGGGDRIWPTSMVRDFQTPTSAHVNVWFLVFIVKN